MKSLLTILIIAGLAGGVVIGLLTMGEHGDCVASYAAGTACPLFNVLAYIGMHVNFVRNFSEALLTAALAAVSILAVFISYVFSAGDFYTDKRFFGRGILENTTVKKHKQISWLSLFENSPNTE
ncbi:MAG: hypothetical protein Q7S78_02665 [Candidatus Azambacteria bacterium]|nr:hypothetical protein [Candidatus Azambacteria bacterium]